MRKTKLGLFLVMCVVVLAMLTACGGSGGGYMSNVDPAKAEKAFLSAVNKALGTEFVNDESLRGKADYIWNKVDQNGKILWTDSVWFPTGENGELFWVSPIFNSETFGEDSKFQLTAFTEEELKKYENPSEELLARVKREIAPADSSTEITSICVTARNIGGKVYVVYVKESKSK